MDFLRFPDIEVIAFALIPVPVMVCESIQRPEAYTVRMPVGMDEVHPFLAVIAACGAVKEVIGTLTDLVKQGNEVALHSGLLYHIEAELAAYGFELVACLVHATKAG